MSNWSGGYSTSVRYLDTVQSGTAPLVLDVSLMTAGRGLPHSDGVYRYAELGCGTAFSMIALAAANPQSTFVGYDFMPEHVVRARSMIEEAGLVNVEVHEASFEDLANGAAPEAFDYIVLHGVWSWVSPENQAYLTQILGRWLVPGGVAYLGYAAMAGWAHSVQIRQIFKQAPIGPAQDRYGPARAAVDTFVKLQNIPHLEKLWEAYSGMSDDYIAHDFAAEDSTAHWHNEMVDLLSQAKLEYAGPVNLIEHFDPLCHSDEKMAFLGMSYEQGWIETGRDLAYGRSFRTDIFTKGAPILQSAQTRRNLGKISIASWEPLLVRDNRPLENAPDRPMDPALTRQIDAALSRGIQSVDDFVKDVDLPPMAGMQAALHSVALGKARFVRSDAETEAARDSVAGFHEMLIRRHRDNERFPGVASARIGGPFSLSSAEKAAIFDGADSGEDIAKGVARLELPKI